MAKTTKTKTAAETYAERRTDIARLMDVLQMELDRHAKVAELNPRDWGYAGDLGKIRGDLIELVAFAGRLERKDVEEFLADANAEVRAAEGGM